MKWGDVESTAPSPHFMIIRSTLVGLLAMKAGGTFFNEAISRIVTLIKIIKYVIQTIHIRKNKNYKPQFRTLKGCAKSRYRRRTICKSKKVLCGGLLAGIGTLLFWQ